ncbi:hypothetical protein CEXT_55811 [Caerostris extrusa]|uniref:Uncharacterized protein n=1 Tax=Caerostris extrusa TaxID=172846 RepID=A0AAV4VG11_CAEEX|nr:hypothetical protein CEXT_55811 [Caerostris extrusa]
MQFSLIHLGRGEFWLGKLIPAGTVRACFASLVNSLPRPTPPKKPALGIFSAVACQKAGKERSLPVTFFSSARVKTMASYHGICLKPAVKCRCTYTFM